jgi:GGDEF domain-containing protein
MFSRITKILREYKEWKYLAYHDPLTGVLNRNWLNAQKMSIKNPYVYFIDINDLTEVNKFGHTVGDMHIINVVKHIPQVDGDYLVRYAGDEFILFSNYENLISTNKLYSVGMSTNRGDLPNSIMEADIKMIESKKAFKNIKNE